MSIKKGVINTEKIIWNHKNTLILIISLILAYFILKSPYSYDFIARIRGFGYIGSFISGIFFAYGSTTAPALASLIVISKELNPWLVILTGALGAIISDFFIFSYVKYGLVKEFKTIGNEIHFHPHFNHITIIYTKKIAPFIAGMIIASPLPDEIAAAMLGSINYKSIKFLIISFIAKLMGIGIILGIADIL